MQCPPEKQGRSGEDESKIRLMNGIRCGERFRKVNFHFENESENPLLTVNKMFDFARTFFKGNSLSRIKTKL